MRLFRQLPTVVTLLLTAGVVHAQIDPTKRELIQLGYNQPLQGVSPLSGYGFYYLNIPYAFHETNLALRLVVAPVYLDSELGIRGVFTPYTDLGIGLAGGGFADSYHEIRQGDWKREESFDGHGFRIPISLYHLFNPSQRIPLYGLLRGEYRFATYDDTHDTAPTFQVPDDQNTFHVRAGLRYGGMEPVLFPELAMELSAWYEGEIPLNPGLYGYNGDRRIEAQTHLYYGRALLAYTFPESKQRFSVSITGGGSVHPDRLNSYRLGGLLPLMSEFPLSLPGYYYQELSAERQIVFIGSYFAPLDHKHRFSLVATAASAAVDYLPGFEQSNTWNSGVGGGLVFAAPSGSWQIMLGYGYGFDAIRSGGERGGQNVGLLLQFDLDRAKTPFFDDQGNPLRSKGIQQLFHSLKMF